MDPDLSDEDAAILADLRRLGSTRFPWTFTYDSDSGTWTAIQVLRKFTAPTLPGLKQAIDADFRARYYGHET